MYLAFADDILIVEYDVDSSDHNRGTADMLLRNLKLSERSANSGALNNHSLGR